jgi:hypothetical protein
MSGLFNKNQKVGLLQQALFATPNDNSAAFRTQLVKPGSLPDAGIIIDTFNETSAYGTAKEVGRTFVDSTTALKSFGYEFTPVYTELYHYLNALLKCTTEGAAPGFKKLFLPMSDFTNGASVNYGADEGNTYGIAQGNYNDGASVGDGTILSCAIIDELSFDIDFDANGINHLLQASVKWVGNQMVADQYFDGDWVDPVSTGRLSGFALNTLTVDGVSYSGVCPKKINIKFKNNVTAACTTTKANDYDTQFSMITTITLIANETSIGAFGKYTNGFINGSPVNVAFNISNGTDTSLGVLSFKNTYGELMSSPFVTNGDKTEVNLVIEALRPAAGWSEVVTLADGVDILV